MTKSVHIYAWIVLLLIFQGCASVPKQQVSATSTNLRLYVFECGQNNVADISMFSPGVGQGQKKTLIVSCFLLKHPKGILLWDSGLSDELAKTPEGISLRDGKFHLSVKKPFLAQLAEIGVTPKDVDYVAFSHFHADHVGNANAFLNSKILMQEKEYEAAFSADPSIYGFSLKTYDKLKNSRIQKLNGDYDVFGDGSVVIKSSPGHTPGHQSLFIELPKTGPILLSGDLYHFTDNRIHRRVPIFNFDKAQTEQSMAVIEDFVNKTHATMWIQHDYEQIGALRHAPLFYE